MNVTIKLQTTLKKFAPEGTQRGEVPLDLPDGSTAKDAVAALKIPEDFVGAVFIDGQRVELETALVEGQEVNLLAPIGGG